MANKTLATFTKYNDLKIFNSQLPFLSILIFIFLIIQSCSAPQLYKSQWYEKDKVFLGTYYDSDNDFVVKCLNDSENLYLRIETKNIRTISKFLTLGLSVWIDPMGNKRRKFGVHYPLPEENLSLDYKNEINKTILSDLSGDMHFSEIELVGFDGLNRPIKYFIKDLTTAIQPHTYFSKDYVFVYQLKISFSEMGLSIEDITNISVYYESKWLVTPEYLSSMTAKEAMLQKTSIYKAGEVEKGELTDKWIQISLSKKN